MEIFIKALAFQETMSKKKEANAREEKYQEEISRIKLPRGTEIFGILETMLGGSRMRVRCFDGKERICRIPGRLKRKIWVREGDVIVIEPWEFDGDHKGDVVFKYRASQVDWLKRKGYLKQLESSDEF